MSPSATPATTTLTFVVRFWREWSQGQPRWRGRVEHVESGQQANFLAIEDLLAFFRRFGIGAAIATAGRRDDEHQPNPWVTPPPSEPAARGS